MGQAGWREQHGQNHWVLLLPLSSLCFPISIKIGCLVTAASIVGLTLPATTWARERRRQTQKSDLEQKLADRVSRDWGPGDRDLKYHCQIFGRPGPLELSGD